MIKLLMILTFCLPFLAKASQHQTIDTLGASPKGQFVAVEEYGYLPHTHRYYVSIRVMNVWKKEYVGQPIHLETPAHRPHYLGKVRSEAKTLAQDQLKLFQIAL